MLRLIYEKSSFFKAEIIRLIVENNGQINKNLLIKELYLSSATINKYLQELHNELPDKALIISDSLIIFNYKNFSLYDVQKFYFSQSVVKDILHYCFFQPKLTFEQLAGKLYISHSKLFNILKFMDKNLENVGIYIQRRPYVILEGNLEAIMVLYNLCLQIEKQPFEKSFSKINVLDLQNRVVTFLDYYHMKAEYFVIRELCIWILTVHDRFYLQKVCKTHNTICYDNFINAESPLLNKIKETFSIINPRSFDKEGCFLILIFLIFNMSSLHFENMESEKYFFSHELIEEYHYQSFILSVLMKDPYNVSPSSLEVLSIKIEGCIHFSNLIYPYYYFSRTLLTPKLKRSGYLKKIQDNLKEDFKDMFINKNININWVYELLSYMIIAFQKRYITDNIVNVGVYSIRGTIFETQYCQELKEAINISPYYELNEQDIDILIIDDIELLNTVPNYKTYMIVGDATYNRQKQSLLFFQK